MRLGAYPCVLEDNTLSKNLYKTDKISERHRHRYEFNNNYREKLADNNFIFAGLSPDKKLVEVVELQEHTWFVGVQFHPEFKSTPMQPHPLFASFIAAALVFQQRIDKAA